MSDFVTQAGPLRERIESELDKLFTPDGLLTDADIPVGLVEPMRYALLGGGKRLRPVLCLAACQALCGDPAPALPAALAIELLHNYTLVHDDLPCMDDDQYRRGRLTVHAKYGYGKAVLVGDALQAAAFALVLTPPKGCRLWVGAQLRIARTLAQYAGPAGVIGGQWVDVTAEPPHDEARIDYVHTHKTGDLIRCAVAMGAIAAGASASQIQAASEYGLRLGLAFQQVDDVLDADDPAKANELSILRICPKAEALDRARANTDKALAALARIEPSKKGFAESPASEETDGHHRRREAFELLQALAESQISRTV